MELHKCPECSKPFLPLLLKEADLDRPGFEHCPRCGKRTFEVDKSDCQGIIAFDGARRTTASGCIARAISGS